MMKEGHRGNSVGGRKLIWDEVIGLPLAKQENRLLSVDDNLLVPPVFGCVRQRPKRVWALFSLARKVVSNYLYDCHGWLTKVTTSLSDYDDDQSQHTLPILVENLILRIMGLPSLYRDGSDHSPLPSIIPNYLSLPAVKL